MTGESPKISRLCLTVKTGERYMIDGIPVEVGRRTVSGVVLVFELRQDQLVKRVCQNPTKMSNDNPITS